MPVAYSYIRMSRPEQLRGDSLRRQVEKAREWAAKRGVVLDESLRDIGISAYRGKNKEVGALAAFLDVVKAGRVASGSFLVLESLDRLSRETVPEALPTFLDIVNAGITIVTLTDKQEYNYERLKTDWTPLLISLGIMARAHEESKTKAERVRQAWAQKRTKVGEAVLTKRVPAWLRVVDRRIEEVEGRSDIVRRIFREAIAGDGQRAIVKRLNDEGVPSFKTGLKGWQPSYVAKLLKNRAVLGEYQAYSRDEKGVRHPVGEPVPGYYPAIVSAADFLRAGTAARSRKFAPGVRGVTIANLFQGIGKCACCGASMTVRNRGKASGTSLVCSNAARSAGCDNRRGWSMPKVERAVLRELRRVDLPEPDKNERVKDDAATLADAMSEATRRRDRLLDLVEAGDDGAIERVKSLTQRIRALEAEAAKARLNGQVEASLPTRREQWDRVGRLSQALATARGAELREIRTRLAQAIRESLLRVEFGPQVVTCRVRLDRMRSWDGLHYGHHPDGVPFVAIDERPPRQLTVWEIALHEPEPGEREHLDTELERFLRLAGTR
ncbi:recombinase family protein [Methylobacterium terricola]|nr:recombinase family protein [Methylobacterium terricola]